MPMQRYPPTSDLLSLKLLKMVRICEWEQWWRGWRRNGQSVDFQETISSVILNDRFLEKYSTNEAQHIWRDISIGQNVARQIHFLNTVNAHNNWRVIQTASLKTVPLFIGQSNSTEWNKHFAFIFRSIWAIMHHNFGHLLTIQLVLSNLWTICPNFMQFKSN